MYNELTIFFISYLLFPLVNSTNGENSKVAGWVLLVLCLVNIGVNYAAMIVAAIISLFKLLKLIANKICSKC